MHLKILLENIARKTLSICVYKVASCIKFVFVTHSVSSAVTEITLTVLPEFPPFLFFLRVLVTRMRRT